MVSDGIYDDIPPQMKILNMVIPILMDFLTFTHRKHFILRKTLSESFVSDVNHYVDQSLGTLLPTSDFRRYIADAISQDILSQVLDVFQSDIALYSQVH